MNEMETFKELDLKREMKELTNRMRRNFVNTKLRLSLFESEKSKEKIIKFDAKMDNIKLTIKVTGALVPFMTALINLFYLLNILLN